MKKLKELWRLVMHMPVGAFSALQILFGLWLTIIYPPIGLPVAILMSVSAWSIWRAFKTYEEWQDIYGKDAGGSYYDIVGFPWGFALTMILGVVFIIIPTFLACMGY